MSWLLISTEPEEPGRSRLVYQINGHTRRVAHVWGSPPDETTISHFGAAFEREENMRPIDRAYHLGEGA